MTRHDDINNNDIYRNDYDQMNAVYTLVVVDRRAELFNVII